MSSRRRNTVTASEKTHCEVHFPCYAPISVILEHRQKQKTTVRAIEILPELKSYLRPQYAGTIRLRFGRADMLYF